MSAESEALIQRAKSVRNVASGGQLVTKATRFMTVREKNAKTEQLREAEETLSPHNIGAPALTQEGRAHLGRYRNYLKKDLAENAAPSDLSAETRDACLKEERRLAEKISAGRQPEEIMRRNPTGAVGHYMKFENGSLKDDTLAWQNLRRINNPDDDSEDLANPEMLRRSLSARGMPTTFMADAQIPGYMAYNHIPDENWEAAGLPLVTPGSPMARKSAEELEAEIAVLKEQLKMKADTPKEQPAAKVQVKAQAKAKPKGMSEEAKQRMRDMMNKRWADKKAKQTQPSV